MAREFFPGLCRGSRGFETQAGAEAEIRAIGGSIPRRRNDHCTILYGKRRDHPDLFPPGFSQGTLPHRLLEFVAASLRAPLLFTYLSAVALALLGILRALPARDGSRGVQATDSQSEKISER